MLRLQSLRLLSLVSTEFVRVRSNDGVSSVLRIIVIYSDVRSNAGVSSVSVRRSLSGVGVIVALAQVHERVCCSRDGAGSVGKVEERPTSHLVAAGPRMGHVARNATVASTEADGGDNSSVVLIFRTDKGESSDPADANYITGEIFGGAVESDKFLSRARKSALEALVGHIDEPELYLAAHRGVVRGFLRGARHMGLLNYVYAALGWKKGISDLDCGKARAALDCTCSAARPKKKKSQKNPRKIRVQVRELVTGARPPGSNAAC